jgi:RNA polymerase sigma-70 factor (ECF subfamily)
MRVCTGEARRLVRCPADADEVAQEALARAWAKRATCRTGQDPVPWVLQITRNEAWRLMAQRRSRATRELCVDDGAAIAATAPGQDAVISRLDVARALQRLGSDDRRLVAARYVLDLTQPSAARLLGIPAGTAKVRLHRIRHRLRQSLTDQ